MKPWVLVFCVTAAAACAGQDDPSGADPGAEQSGEAAPRSGLAEDARIADLSDADLASLCDWWNTTLGGPRMQSCSECNGNACTDWDVSVSSNADCVADLKTYTCSVTVSQAEDCAIGEAPDLCVEPDACKPLLGC